MAHKLEYLLEFCNTDAQRRVVQMFIEGHSGPEIAEATGRGHRSGPDTMLRRIKKRAARLGHAPGHFEHGVAEGFRIGKTTIQRGPDGSVERTWERQYPEAELTLDIIEAAIERLPEAILPAVPAPAARSRRTGRWLRTTPGTSGRAFALSAS